MIDSHNKALKRNNILYRLKGVVPDRPMRAQLRAARAPPARGRARG